MESPIADTHPDADDIVYPCKGCGQILEEGKAFELAGNRWHIDCFRCNTCGTLLDSDANLLLLGDGSLICNNCTYSCSACGNKIEDLAILTGDQAFCASCFKCRNCKKKIDNLRYARTSQGIFCMQCHESLMARRRKRSKQAGSQRTPSAHSTASGTAGVDKTLPALPPTSVNTSMPAPPDIDSPASGSNYTTTPVTDSMPLSSKPKPRKDADYVNLNKAARDSQRESARPTSVFDLPIRTSRHMSDDFYIPVTLDGAIPGSPTNNLSPTITQSSVFDGPKEDQLPDLGSTSSVERAPSKDRSNRGGMYSPHIAFQEKGREASSEMVDTLKRREASGRNSPTSSGAPSPYIPDGGFKLQDAPRERTSKSSQKSLNLPLSISTEHSPTLDQVPMQNQEKEPAQIASRKASFRRSPLGAPDSWDQKPPSREENGKTPQNRPTVARKEVSRTDGEFEDAMRRVHARSVDSQDQLAAASLNAAAAGPPPPRSTSRAAPHREDDVSFTAPREAPPPPPTHQPPQQPGYQNSQPLLQPRHKTSGSVSSIQSEKFQSRDPLSPLPHYNNSGEFTMEDEMGQIMKGDLEPPGLFRRVSKAVKQGRRDSDKAIEKPSPSPRHWRANSKNGLMDISSPIMAKPEGEDDVGVLRSKLLDAQRKIAELEADKMLLNERIDGTHDIRQVNTELREKRSTMAFLDSQREMIVRELEVMTDHLTKAKDSNKPINLEELKVEACKDLARSLKRLEESLGSQIEDLVRQKNDLLTELSTLVQMKDKGMAEYEALEQKNTQLMQLHESLVQNIQALYRQGKIAGPTPNGLGINTTSMHDYKPRVDSISDARSAVSAEAGASQFSGETEVENASPKVVDIRKGGQAKKFNWKRGGQAMSKSVAKGIKGAFGGVQGSSLREEQFAEGVPYGALEAGEAPIVGNVPARLLDKDRRNWNFPQQSRLERQMSETRAPAVTALPPETSLYGSDLSARADYERRVIPAIVTRCIEEVEHRGMMVEGIYRKSGSSSQVKAIQAGFEKDFAGFDIGDPDLDIHAVTSAVKQYLRKLPEPLITFEGYELLLDAASMYEGKHKLQAFVKCVESLPRTHRDTLEFLIFHLARVMEKESSNLMTPTNLAVVFAPTVMRPQIMERELSDMEGQRHAIEYLLKHHQVVFAGGS